MKTSRRNGRILATFGLLWSAWGVAGAVAETVELGASREQVIESLGEPLGAATMRGVEVLYYARGQVDLREGQVIRTSVLSKADYEANQQRLAEEAEARRKQAEEAAEQQAQVAEQRAQAAKERLAEIDENDALAGKSAAQQAAFWKSFQKQNPGVDVQSRLASAQDTVRKEAAAATLLERRVQEEMAKPIPGVSSRRLRKFRRGRSPSATAQREAVIREQLSQELGQP